MFEVINKWMLESTDNFNVIVGITMFLYVGSLSVLVFIQNKLGKPDERTNAIYLKITSVMFTTQLIMSSIFIVFIDRNIDYFRQFLILFQGIVFFVGAIYAFKLYRKEFK